MHTLLAQPEETEYPPVRAAKRTLGSSKNQGVSVCAVGDGRSGLSSLPVPFLPRAIATRESPPLRLVLG